MRETQRNKETGLPAGLLKKNWILWKMAISYPGMGDFGSTHL
jgi:hypothetical protein